jgi:hypothetical protein
MTETRDGSRGSRSAPRLKDVIATARSEFEALTGRAVDSVSSVRRREDGWTVCVEVVELERIPASTSVLGAYEALVDDEGSLLEYERTGRYYRNQASEGDS